MSPSSSSPPPQSKWFLDDQILEEPNASFFWCGLNEQVDDLRYAIPSFLIVFFPSMSFLHAIFHVWCIFLHKRIHRIVLEKLIQWLNIVWETGPKFPILEVVYLL